jgi:hypothetical protein
MIPAEDSLTHDKNNGYDTQVSLCAQHLRFLLYNLISQINELKRDNLKLLINTAGSEPRFEASQTSPSPTSVVTSAQSRLLGEPVLTSHPRKRTEIPLFLFKVGLEALGSGVPPCGDGIRWA